ncbi:hypothetical protein F2Q68_00037234 [Brassica cretica]|uniref:Dolichyl-diphosphooligosaccharide--protein glycosyltransferase subunit 2 n=1 Tax=Brassica cretica TaxID=69181 RepID=A0A8S9H0X3_BRACR|nr:hypothetical protein F2Q68_00037234 [Brassica cretica]
MENRGLVALRLVQLHTTENEFGVLETKYLKTMRLNEAEAGFLITSSFHQVSSSSPRKANIDRSDGGRSLKPQSPLTTDTLPVFFFFLPLMMARGLVRFLVSLLLVAICNAASVSQPISDSHRSAALDVFVPLDGSYKSNDGPRSSTVPSFSTPRSNLQCCFGFSAHFRLSPIRGSRCLRATRWILQKAYEALKTLEILGMDKKSDLSSGTCENVVNVLGSPSSALKDVFYALSVNGILKCKSGEDVPMDIVSKLQAGAKDAKLLLDFYYSIRGLVLVKEQFSGTDLTLGDAEAIFRSVKALSQSDGRWRYSSNNAESSTFAAGLAFETLAGVISLAPSEIDQSLIQTVKTGILKLFDSLQKYEDGTFYFDGSEGPISTTASAIRGLTSFAASESTGLNLPGDKIVGLAKFFLGVGIPGDAKDFFNQIDALACLEDNRQG